MSRCFQFPPPGYTLSSAQYETLIELIKLQKEKQSKKEKRKEEKQRKKEKEKRKEENQRKKEKEEKSKERTEKRKEETNPNSDKSDVPNHHISHKSDIPKHQLSQSGQTDTKVDFFRKKREAETEQLELSSLTDEHACPASLPVPSSSSESTEKSKKRKRDSSTRNDTHVHDKAILIPKPSKTQNALNEERQQACSTSERSDGSDGSGNVDCGRDRDGPAKFLNRSSNSSAHVTEQICSTSGQNEAGKTGISRLELQYQTLLEDCFPPPIQDGCVFPMEDLDWLFAGRNQETRPEKKSRFGNESLSCSRSMGLWPRAEYLPEVGIYALPYTVPY